MTVRERAIEAVFREPKNKVGPVRASIIIAAYEAAMLEAGWKMTPRRVTAAMKRDQEYAPSLIERLWRHVWDRVP